MLHPDKNKRITIEEIFTHPWVVKNELEKKKTSLAKPIKSSKFHSTVTLATYSEDSLKNINNNLNNEDINKIEGQDAKCSQSGKIEDLAVVIEENEDVKKNKKNSSKNLYHDMVNKILNTNNPNNAITSESENSGKKPVSKKKIPTKYKNLDKFLDEIVELSNYIFIINR